MHAVDPGVFVNAKFTVGPPQNVAVTLKAPAVAFAVSVVAVAKPEASVCIVTEPLPANVALAPLTGAVNATSMLGTGLLLASVTSSRGNVAKAVVTGVD